MTDVYGALNLFLDFCVIGILILGIYLFRHPEKARYGNLTAAFALVCAAALILIRNGSMHPWIIVVAFLAGSLPGFWVARKITMIQIPAMVAFQHGAGGVAAFFLSFAELIRGSQHLGLVNEISGLLGLAIGSLTFSGSMIAGGKLSNRLKQTPVVLPDHTRLVIANLGVILVLILAALVFPLQSQVFIYVLIVAAAILFGVIFSIRIGGADMPVLISFLNATAGVAAAFCGMIIENNLLICCGATVAASGSILTHVMCKGMNRSLYRVFIPVPSGLAKSPAPKADVKETADKAPRNMEPHARTTGTPAPEKPEPVQVRPAEKQDGFQRAADYARKADRIIIVPGYGMAVAQAQFAVIELTHQLMAMGKTVWFAIHPVAGRMPGHMNVLLAEAGIDYDLLKEMDEINPDFKTTDLTLVIGACDVVNPAAIEAEDTPISGMPILMAHESGHVVCCNLDEKPGYSGVDNPLYRNANTTLLLGNARETIERLIRDLSEAPAPAEPEEALPADMATRPEPQAPPLTQSPLDEAIAALTSAGRIIVIPGYGMALAQAQFKVVELTGMLIAMGKDVRFAIHPVAGRMPGHMNVLLAEADVDYDLLKEMDEINPEFAHTDVAMVIGACDVVNPAAMETEGTPISGMPILNAHEAGRVIVCNFDEKPGYSGVDNTLYQHDKTILLLGDAAATVKDLIDALRA